MTTTTTVRTPGRARRRLRVPDAWLRASLAGIEAAVLGWLIVVVPTVAAYVATAAAPVLGEASWMDAAVVGTGFWLLGHGAAIDMTDGGAVSLAPIGVTLVGIALVYGAVRRARLRSHDVGAFTVAGYLVAVLGISAVVPGSAGRIGVAVMAVVVAGVGLQLALWRSRALPPAWWVRLRDQVPAPVRAGLRGGLLALAGLLLVATVVAAIALVQGVVMVLELHETLEPGLLGSVVLVLGQLAYLPTLVLWALAWIAGPGFSVGAGTLFSPTEVVAGPLPAIPVFGALPEPGHPGLGWWLLAGVLVGAVIGGWLHRERFEAAWWRAALSGVTAAAVAGVGAALLSVLASGAVGPGRMASVGADAPQVALAVGWQAVTGALIVLLVAHPQVHELVRRGYRVVRGRVGRGTAAAGAGEVGGAAAPGADPDAEASNGVEVVPHAAVTTGSARSAATPGSAASARTAGSAGSAATPGSAASVCTAGSAGSAATPGSASSPDAAPAALSAVDIAWMPTSVARSAPSDSAARSTSASSSPTAD